MKSVTLNILASDIRTTSYFDSINYPITRALNRAGYYNLYDTGMSIKDSLHKRVTNSDQDNYHKLAHRVTAMFRSLGKLRPTLFPEGQHVEEPADFSVTLQLDI